MNNLKFIAKKILYYRDIKLLLLIFLASLRLPISFSPNHKKKYIYRTNQNISSKQRAADKDKMTRYVNFYFYLLKKIGFRSTCLTRSALLCYVLRKHGFNAQINFGIKTNPDRDNLDPSFLGHCWVSVVNENHEEKDYDTISQYP